MNTGRGLCFLLLFTIAIEAMLSPRGIPGILHAASEGFQGEAEKVRTANSQNLKEYLNLNHIGTPSLEKVKASQLMPDRSLNGAQGCPPLQRRSLVLVRRGCISGVAKGLSATANGLSKSASRLKHFDEFFSPLSFRQKLAWFGQKGVNGVRRTARFGYKGLNFLWRTLRYGAIKTKQGTWFIARGTWKVTTHTVLFAAGLAGWTVLSICMVGWTILKGTWKVAKFVSYKVPIYSWRYLGKGLAATGRGFQKAGTRMEAQSAARLAKKVPPSPMQ